MDLSRFRHITSVDIRFGDMDAMGHVNNAKYLTYLETARIRYFKAIGQWDDRVTSGIGPIMARAEVDFKLPLMLDDEIVQVYTRCMRLRGRSYETEQLVVRRDGATAARGIIVLVCYDYARGMSVLIPDHWRAAIRDYEVTLPEGA